MVGIVVADDPDVIVKLTNGVEIVIDGNFKFGDEVEVTVDITTCRTFILKEKESED